MSSPDTEISQPTPMEKRGMGRRTFMKGIGASAVAGVGLSGRGPTPAVGSADAIAPAVIYGAAVGGSVAVGWALREFEVIGSDSPPEGLTPDALQQGIYETARTRESTNASTFIDNRNILDGVKHTAYVDGKIEAIEALNEQSDSSAVQDAAIDSVNDYETVIKENIFKSWNEAAEEFYYLVQALEDHSDTNPEEVFGIAGTNHDDPRWYSLETAEMETVDVDMPDGSTFDMVEIYVESTAGSAQEFSAIDGNNISGTDGGGSARYDGGVNCENPTDSEQYVDYLRQDEWGPLIESLESTFDSVRDGLITWVDNVYSDVQSGEIDVEELITPRERAAMMEEDEGMAQAIADLAALNVPVDVGREATIYLPHVDATIRGTVGATGSTTIEAGESYDPELIDGSIYLTYDASLGEGTWGAFETGVDGGTVTFTEEPWPGVVYRLETLADETVDLTADDFTALDANGDPVEDLEDPDRWETDISEDVEDSITEIVEVQYFSESGDTDFQTIRLADPFEVTSITDVETGDEVPSLDYSQSEPQTDTNYITQEEWDDLAAQNEELIQMYEDSQGGGGGFGFDDFDLGPIPGGGVVVGAIALGAYLLGR